MPKVSEAHRESRRDQILDAALECFAERGFSATSMADILAASGLSAGAVYSYFGGKREIVVAAARRAIGGATDELLGALDDDGTPPPPSAVIRAIGMGVSARVQPGIVLQVWAEAGRDDEFRHLTLAEFESILSGLRAYLARWAVASGRTRPDDAERWAASAVMALVGIAQGWMVQRTILPDFDPDSYVEAVSLLLD